MKIVAVILIILLLLFAAFWFIAFTAFKFTIARPKIPKQPKNEDERARQKIRNENNTHLIDSQPLPVSITSFDGLILRGLLKEPKEGCKKFAVCIHGYKCNGRDEMSHLFRFYHDEMGFGYLVPDDRAHGKSEGKYTGFGYLDSFDVLKWTEFLVGRYGEDIEIILHGISMGAATVMTAAGNEKLPKQVKCVIEDCGFSRADEQIGFTIKSMTKMRLPVIKRAASLICKVKAGYFFSEASPIKALENTRLPIMFVHGTADPTVPFYMVNDLFESYKGEKELFVVEGARHARSYYIARDEYNARMRSFIGRHMTSKVFSDHETEKVHIS